ncbi:MAG: hypothetical protein IJ010_02465 [Ruminococcus sp.]|nr:hypothetical protein [Ruminococcus sp.]
MRVRFHLPGLATNYGLNVVFISMLKNCPHYFREGVEIASVFGAFPQSLWNGGRTNMGLCNMDFVSRAVKTFNNQGVPLRFTFTNPVLEEKHLSDKFCNDVMKLADNGFNEVIINSPLLEDYIRKNYPNYKLTSSTCKRITDPEELREELEKDYHIVVLDYDLNNKFDILEALPHKEKCEILVNACCNPGCKMRKEHYRRLGLQQIQFCEHIRKNPGKPMKFSKDDKNSVDMNCGCEERTIFDNRKLSTNISPDDIWEKYVPMGFEHFKIEGRTLSKLNLVETYIYYMIKPEFRDEARFAFLYNLHNAGIINIA